MNLEKIISAVESKGHNVFKNDTKPYNLNIVGVRTDNRNVNSFDDWLTVFWKFKGEWEFIKFRATTDPGLFYLNHPLSPKGTAILKEGQYTGAFQIGKHQGKYKALTQKSPLTVIRDFDRDSEIDLNSGKEQTGIFGINIHRALHETESVNVNKWSAGCQVFANPDEFRFFISLCEMSKKNWSDSFTYTLINSSDL